MINEPDLATVLLVDDNIALLRNLAFLLDIIGFEVKTATSGAEALKRIQTDTPDLVIADIDLPVINGYDLLRALRSDPNLQHVPFIFASLRYELDDLMYGLDLGATDYIPKPFDIYDVLDAIQRSLPTLTGLEFQRPMAS
jgi:DNA-binding response OmpR family regulator